MNMQRITRKKMDSGLTKREDHGWEKNKNIIYEILIHNKYMLARQQIIALNWTEKDIRCKVNVLMWYNVLAFICMLYCYI